jgi:8-oxo-dGTP diphosphatase
MILTTLCYVQHDGHILMLSHIKRVVDIHFGKWNGLGGKLELGEIPEQCATRAVHEESGLEIRSPRMPAPCSLRGSDC